MQHLCSAPAARCAERELLRRLCNQLLEAGLPPGEQRAIRRCADQIDESNKNVAGYRYLDVLETLQALHADTVELLATMVASGKAPSRSSRNRLAQSARAMSQHTEAILQQLKIDLKEMQRKATEKDKDSLPTIQDALSRMELLATWTQSKVGSPIADPSKMDSADGINVIV